MCTQSVLSIVTNEVVKAARERLGEKLDKVILYGSYARGDNDDESDIDIMILAYVDNDELERLDKELWDRGWSVGLEHDVMVSVFVKEHSHFHEWMDAMAYYRNILEDGVILYE